MTPSSRRRALVLAALLLSAACMPHGRWAPGLAQERLERLYFGRNIGDTAVVSDSAWQRFALEVITPAFPEGSTTWNTDGRWRAPNGETTRERGFVVELLHPASVDVEANIARVIDEYKRRFAQQSVLRIVTDVRASF